MYRYDTLINIIIKYKNKIIIIIILVYRYDTLINIINKLKIIILLVYLCDTPYVSLRYTNKALIKS